MISIQLGNEQSDIHQKLITRSKELLYEETVVKKPNFKTREMIVHLSVKVCTSSEVLLERGMKPYPLTRMFSGRLRHLIEVETSQMQRVNRCYTQTSDSLMDKRFATAISRTLKALRDPSNYDARSRYNQIAKELRLN